MPTTTSFMARFGHNERVDIPAEKINFDRNMPDQPAFLAFIWMVNKVAPGVFGEPKIVVDFAFTSEEYPDARVVMGNGSREQRVEEGFRIVTRNPDLVPVFEQIAEWIYANSYTAKECSDCLIEVRKGWTKALNIAYAEKGTDYCMSHRLRHVSDYEHEGIDR